MIETIASILVAYLLIRAAIWLIEQFVNAPAGWEDKNGFHLGRPK